MSATPDPRLKAETLTIRTLTGFDETVRVLGSKSYTNRYLAIASLSGQETVIDNALLSDDTVYFSRAVTGWACSQRQRALRSSSMSRRWSPFSPYARCAGYAPCPG